MASFGIYDQPYGTLIKCPESTTLKLMNVGVNPANASEMKH
jgi:hypothetical protein